jgi:hypothetical protein
MGIVDEFLVDSHERSADAARERDEEPVERVRVNKGARQTGAGDRVFGPDGLDNNSRVSGCTFDPHVHIDWYL